MKTLTLMIDGIKTTFRVKDVLNFTRYGGVKGTTYHLIKSKNTRVGMIPRTVWQPESFTLTRKARNITVELLCSKVRNNKPTYSLFDVAYIFDVQFVSEVI